MDPTAGLYVFENNKISAPKGTGNPKVDIVTQIKLSQ
jgi:hypothetical protein